MCIWLHRDSVSLCNGPGCPGTHFGGQAGSELTEILLPLHKPPCLALSNFFISNYVYVCICVGYVM